MIKKNHYNFNKVFLIFSLALFIAALIPFVRAEVICNNNLDCDDQSVYTSDNCVNPGADSSYCDYAAIKCNNNNDCGTTGFFGAEFCSTNDVFKLFQSSVCKNPGTTSSSCEIKNNSLLIVDCGDNHCDNFDANYCKGDDVYRSRWCYTAGCSEGICYNNQTNDEQLVRNCINGCSNGACINQPICSINNDCGQDVLLNQFFCKSNNVFDKQAVNSCNNPGTLDSFCSVVYLDVLSQTCSNGCSNGQCINQTSGCQKNSDCGKTKTEYICDGENVKKIKTVPECNSGSCESEVTEEFVRTCADGCSNGVCKDGNNHRKNQTTEDDYQEVTNKIIKPVEIVENDYAANDTINKIALNKNNVQIKNVQTYFGDGYFWLILFLILVFIILIVILVVIQNKKLHHL